jgi:hypothetical protein
MEVGRRNRVVVLGGWFGGLNVARGLADADVEVTLVDRTNHHLFQPLLYQVAEEILAPGQIAPALRRTVKKQANDQTLLAEVSDLDLERKEPDGRVLELAYDTLVLATGATHSYFGKDHFAEFAPGMKTVEDARYLRDGILVRFEMAELATDPKGTRRVADLRGHRGRPGRCRAGRPDRRAGPSGAASRLSVGGHHRGQDHPAEGRGGGAATVPPRAPAVRQAPAGEGGRRGSGELARGGHGPPLHHGKARTGWRRSAPGRGSGQPG